MGIRSTATARLYPGPGELGYRDPNAASQGIMTMNREPADMIAIVGPPDTTGREIIAEFPPTPQGSQQAKMEIGKCGTGCQIMPLTHRDAQKLKNSGM